MKKPAKRALQASVAILCLMQVACNTNNPAPGSRDKGHHASDTLFTASDSLDDIKICTELLPPPRMEPNAPAPKADTFLAKRKDGTTDQFIHSVEVQQIAGLFEYYWPEDVQELKVMFIDGDPQVQRRVTGTAKKWEPYMRMKFKFGSFAHPDITVSFAYRGSWSYIGTYSREVRPSMNFGWLYANTDQGEYDRVVLHEFGHALGCIHEHQNPRGNIPWDRDKVYAYYAGRPNLWDKTTVDNNIFKKYSMDQVNATEFDPKSIMLYAIPASLTTNGFHTDANNELSAMDKKFIDSIYHRRQYSFSTSHHKKQNI